MAEGAGRPGQQQTLLPRPGHRGLAEPWRHQGPCKVSFARPDLRLWRAAAESGLLNHGCAVYLHGERSAPAQVRVIWWSVWRREGPESTPIAASRRSVRAG